MRCVVAPDSFKGSLSASDAARAIARGIRRAWRNAEIIEFPLADGGEGTLDLIAAREVCEIATLSVPGADGRKLDARYGLLELEHRRTAVIESAAIIGATSQWSKPVLERSTYGIGVLMRALQARGVEQFVVALGGTATNDGGAGMLAALGAKFFNAAGRVLAPVPAQLADLERVDFSELVRPAGLLGLADVDNPLTGAHGATRTFGPQKGVAAEDVAAVETTFVRYAAICDRALNTTASSLPSSGAAGGLGYAIALLGGELVNGADWLLERYDFKALLAGADWLITGEGCSDAQTLHGKGPWRLAAWAKRAGVRSVLISGALDVAAWPALNAQFEAGYALGVAGDPTAMREAASRLEETAMRWAQEAGKIESR